MAFHALNFLRTHLPDRKGAGVHMDYLLAIAIRTFNLHRRERGRLGRSHKVSFAGFYHVPG
jgi:hypothetical protein